VTVDVSFSGNHISRSLGYTGSLQMQFKVGEVVQLKSGGPKMTVQNIQGNEVWCTWFDEQKKPQRHWFAPEMLEKA
jgi:uncharacterized protein YodC (DUF2158 family)